MDQVPAKEIDFGVDLEAGVTTSDEVGRADTGNFLTKLCVGFVSGDAGVKAENGASLNVSNCGAVSPEKVKIVIDEKVQIDEATHLADNKLGKEKRKKTSAKKPPKPPRPPRGLSLDAADQKLIKEIADLAMMKRARIERMKALRKMKAAKASSSSSGNLFAMLFTIVFCLVILFQGVSSRSSTPSFQGSPESAKALEVGYVNSWNPSTSDPDLLVSRSPIYVEQYSSLDENKGSREPR